MPGIVGEREALVACWTLFGGAADAGFLRTLDLPTLMRAFQSKVLLLHPERITVENEALRRRQTARFQAISDAYETLLAWLDQAPKGEPATPPSPSAMPAGAVRSRERLGAFLAHRGVITRRTLHHALAWQRRGRPRIGELAVRWGWLTPAQVDEILAIRHPSPRFAKRAVDLGLLSLYRARTLLRFQRARQRRLGDYFVEHGVLDREQLERYADEHRAVATGLRRTASRA